ncbi:MAG: glycosyltransferase family 4 protein [Lacipirellulaceae bacterium]
MPATPSSLRVYVNGLSIGTGGGYTVARELLRHLALVRPGWEVTMGVIDGHKLQSELRDEQLPANAVLEWTPRGNASARTRMAYERQVLAPAIDDGGYGAVLQVNGMILPGLRTPTLAHFQDPFSFRPEAWTTWRERAVAWVKRRSHRDALRGAAVCGWTSEYLRKLVCGALRIEPKRSIVFYNGVPDAWVERARGVLPPWETRPLEIVTVSNVSPYKRQSLVIRALPELRKTPGLEKLEYRILGAVTDAYRDELRRLAASLGVGESVHVEGRVSDARVVEALASARALPLMSVCESFGIPTVEAMTLGTPVVVADCCALPEVCGDAALTVPMDDVPALVERLRSVLTDPDEAERLRSAGAKRVERFQWATIAEQMAAELDRMMARA